MSSEQNNVSAKRGRSVWGRLALAVFLLPIVVVLFPTALVLVPLMLPTLVAFSIDRMEGRPFTITVGLLNAAGSLPAVLELWSTGHDVAVVQDVLTNLFFWLTAYLCASIGWTIYMVLPPMLRNYYGNITASRVEALQKTQDKLVEEWGEDVTGMRRQKQAEAEKAPDANAQMDAAAADLG